ncbi:hypothetical protein FXO38_17730 [Capsicum annuum]|nr:hypothetical protein FXO38_17730 [Capsicum annuum]
MTLEVKRSSSSAILIFANGIFLNFTPRKFVIITGLNCVSNRYDFIFDEDVPNRMVEKYFNGIEIIQKRQLFLAFTEKGMPLAIQVWLYECCSNVPPKIASKVRREFKEIRGLMRKNFKKMKKTFAQRNVVDIEADKYVDEGGLEQSEEYFSPDVVQSSDNISDGTKQQHADKDPDLQNMDYVGTERSLQRLSSEVDQELEANLLGKKVKIYLIKGCTDLNSEKMNVEIDSQQLIPDELLQSINLDYLYSEKVVQHDCRTSDEKIDETILSDSQFTIPDKMLSSLNAYQIQSIIIHPSTNRQDEHEILDAKISETITEDHAQMNRGITDLSSNSLMNAEVELATEEKVRTPPNTQEVTNDEQRDEQLWPDSQNTIPDEFLPSLNVYDQKSIMIHPSANREVNTPIPNLRIRRPSKFKESPYTKKFGSAADHTWTDSYIDVCLYYLRKNSKYGSHSSYKNEPSKSYKYSTVDCNFMNVIRSLNDVYSMDHQNLNAGGQEHHLIEYINGFRIHAAMPWHTVEDIFVPININEKHHWVQAVLSFSERCIFLYDLYEFSGHYAAVLAEIEKIATIIPMCLQTCDFYVKKEIDLQNHPR